MFFAWHVMSSARHLLKKACGGDALAHKEMFFLTAWDQQNVWRFQLRNVWQSKLVVKSEGKYQVFSKVQNELSWIKTLSLSSIFLHKTVTRLTLQACKCTSHILMGKASTICPQYMTYKRLHIVEWGSLQFLLLLHVAKLSTLPRDGCRGRKGGVFVLCLLAGGRWVRIQKIQQVEKPQTGKLVWKGNSSETFLIADKPPSFFLKRSDPRRVEHLKVKVTTFTNDTYLSRMKIAKSYCIILDVAKDYWPKSIQKKLMLGISSKIWGPKPAIKIFDVLHFFWSGGPQQNVVHLFGLQSGGRCRVEVIHSLTETDRCCIAIIASSTLQKQGVAKRTMIWMYFLEFAD